MLHGQYFYNSTIKKSVAVFGTVFNNIRLGKLIDGKLSKVARVPLAYGPRQKFIERIRQREDAENGTKVAIKLPRMSFEITSLSYDAVSKLNSNNRTMLSAVNPANSTTIYQPFYEGVPYKMGIQLNIMTNNQDDALQIIEQILPSFTPEYTISVLNMNGPGRNLDVPITLVSTSLSDDYEQEMSSGHRLIVYSLDFEMKIKFTGNQNILNIGSETGRPVIKHVEVFLHDNLDTTSTPIDKVDVQLGDLVNDTPDNFTVVTTFGLTEELPNEIIPPPD